MTLLIVIFSDMHFAACSFMVFQAAKEDIVSRARKENPVQPDHRDDPQHPYGVRRALRLRHRGSGARFNTLKNITNVQFEKYTVPVLRMANRIWK